MESGYLKEKKSYYRDLHNIKNGDATEMRMHIEKAKAIA
jgi:hypothetical protein